MHASWNQWGGAVPPQVPSYGTGYPQAAAPQASSFPQVNQFPVNAAPPVTAPPVPAPYQNPLYGQPQQPQPQPQQTQQQQWQQWEQWQQQYAQWHQQYGDKYQGPLPTGMLPPNMPSVPNTYSSIPPLPLGAPSAQPPPPDSVPPPSSDKNDTESGKRSAQDGGKEETKKQKTGKGKAETVEDLVEQEKTFDEQFKSWETSFIKWKEQNANHPDKAQYKEYEAKWENWREQLHQKREALRKKRENKEAEVAAAAAAAKEAALATSSNTAGYSTASVTQSNPYLTSNMMYPMAGMYPSQDIPQMTAQPPNYMANYPMYNMPPPTNMPPMSMMPPVAGHHDQQNKMDAAKSTQSLEFLSNSASNAKSIPGLDLVGSDKSISSAVSNIPPSSSLFSYNQDVTKPLHTSDDKPFNFPVPPQANNYNYNNQSQNQYSSFSLSRPPPSLPNQFQKNYNVDQRNDADYNDRNRYDDKFGNRGGMNSKFDYRQTDSRNDSMDRNSKFSSTYTPNFNSEKYAKYLEDEYDDSRFRDPEPPESPQHSKFNNYGRDERNNYSNFRSNQGGGRGGFNNKYDDFKRDFNDLSNNRKEMGRGFRGRPDIRPQFGDRNKPENSFNSRFSNRGPFGRGGPGGDNGPRPSFNSWQSNEPKGPAQDRFDNVESEKTDSGKPISLLDLPMMKPPDLFEKKPFTDGSFGSDIGPEGVANKNDVDNSRLGPNDPGSFKGPPMFGDANNSRSGPKDGSPFEIGVGSRTDMNKFHPPMGFPPKNSQPSTASRNKDGSSGDNSATAEESTEELVLSMTFDYEHVKKTSAESVPDSFDAVYVFDYGHGKKKVVDNKDFIDSLASEVENNGDTALEGDSWSAEKKNDAGKPLPQRIRQSNDLTKELAAILNKSDHSSETKTNENGNDTIEKKIETAPWQRESIDKAEEASKVVAENALVLPNSKLVDDLLLPPGRHSRPIKLVVIMRGLPGSGKTYTAKLMKDKEVELGGSAPRILSLDDYFTVENDTEETDPTSGKKTTKKEMVYEYDADLEPSYHESLVKSFKKTVADGFFPFIIVDCINDKIKKYEEMYSYAMSQGFQVFVCEMDTDASTCVKRNIHSRTEDEINKILEGWEKTPASQTLLDIRSLLQSAAITEVDMADAEEEIEEKKETEESKEETNDDDKIDEETEAKPDQDEGDAQEEDLVDEEAGDEENTEKEGFSSYMESLCTSKWENMENTEDKLDRLDGVSKKRSSTSFKEWLQLPEDQTDLSWYAANDKASESNVSRKKRVRWADLEERVAQEKMRAIGFVVGQTDWNRMMDPSFGGSKLTQTKYIYK